MKTSLAVRSAAALSLSLVSSLALASEAAVEGQGDLGGAKDLLILVGGVAILGVVVWLMTKVLGKMNQPK